MAPPVEIDNRGPYYSDYESWSKLEAEILSPMDSSHELSAYGSFQKCNMTMKCLGNGPLATEGEGYELPTDSGHRSILSIEDLPCDSYKDMGFPREWMIPLLPCDGKVDSENEIQALRTELDALKDRVSQLESKQRQYSSMDTLYSAVTEKSTRYVSAIMIDISRNANADELNGIGNELDRRNESVAQSMEDFPLNESVEPSLVYGTDEESSELNEFVEPTTLERNESVEQSATDVPVLHGNRENPASHASNIDLSDLFEEPNSQMDEENDRQTTESGSSIKCAMCKSDAHSIWKCEAFKYLNMESRWKKAKELGLCFRCLGAKHKALTCKKTKTCGINKCRLNHASLLHDETRRRAKRKISHSSENNAVHCEPSGGENEENKNLTPVPYFGTVEDKQVIDLCYWLMPIPTVDPGGS